MYTTNEKMPRIRRDAVAFAKMHGVRTAARYFGFSPGAIVLWKKKAEVYGYQEPRAVERPLDRGERDRYAFDVCTRSAYAKTCAKMNAATSVQFVAEAETQLGFPFDMIQSDHGPEFGKWFVERIQKKHRYSRIGKPNDNAHIERFNRTLQEECLDKTERTPEVFNKALEAYLPWYNTKRHHFGLGLETPLHALKCSQAID